MQQPGIGKVMTRPLAALGRLRRYPTEYPDYER
jgi:hypothetical protein